MKYQPQNEIYNLELTAIAKNAGEIIMHHYTKNIIQVSYKSDNSPVSIADLEANDFICNNLTKLFPDIPIISEENDNQNQIINNKFWLVDPLDGTKSFIKKNGFFTVNIALIEENKPTLGVIYSPLDDCLYFMKEDQAYLKKSGEDEQIISARTIPEEGATVLISSSLTLKEKVDRFLKDLKVAQVIPIASSIKLCSIAEGKADFYPRFGTTMEWDTAAGHAILKAAGGNILNLNGQELSYGNIDNNFTNPHFIARGFQST
jgi:3'(2'), 5'-bisphosphate nucleotidase